MGCDIHWIIERQHQDGTWEAVMSETYELIKEGDQHGFNFDFKDPGIAFGLRSYQYFGALSGVRQNEDGETIADPGLPQDISDYTRSALEWDDPIDLHSHGWCTLGRLRDAADGAFKTAFLDSENVREVVNHYRDLLETILLREGPEGPTSIFRGARYDPETEIYHPDMRTISNHEKMELVERGKHFKPMSGETVRLLVAYDN
jgi:hypothetical protein